jgi:histidyl-tRNA synthetase
MNPKITQLRRYQIAKVYRRDQPAMTKGRMREFYQCDFDIAGEYDPMIPDAEILRIVNEVFNSLGWENFTVGISELMSLNYHSPALQIKINHRKILDGIFKVAGVPEPLIRPISSAVDKLDKMPWEEVKKEMLEKGLQEEVADTIGIYVKYKGAHDVLELLKADEKMFASEDIKAGVADMELLFSYLKAFNAMDRISFDLSLARGLDYYTGVIYEVITEGSAPPKNAAKGSEAAVGVGSVAAGGRYDELVGMFSGKPIPCVGISFGIDRIISIVNSQKKLTVRSKDVDVFVMAMGGKGFDGMLTERMQIARQLWDAGIKAEFSYKVKPKFQTQFKAAETNGVPLAVILGEDEMKDGKVKIKKLGITDKSDPEKDGVLVPTEDLVANIQKKLQELSDSMSGLQI